jgi:hypothetical protein
MKKIRSNQSSMYARQQNESEETQNRSRSSFSRSSSWTDAVDDFLLQVKATREEKTLLYYTCRLSVLKRWAEEHAVALSGFCARNLRQFLADRADAGVTDATRRHDAVATRAFLKFCKREGYVDGDPLAAASGRSDFAAARTATGQLYLALNVILYEAQLVPAAYDGLA